MRVFVDAQRTELEVTLVVFKDLTSIPNNWHSYLVPTASTPVSSTCHFGDALTDFFVTGSSPYPDDLKMTAMQDLPAAVRQQARFSDHCFVVFASEEFAIMVNRDSSIIRDILLASGVKSVATVTITHHQLVEHEVELQEDSKHYEMVTAAWATAGELLVQPCSSVILELRQGDERKCGRLPVKQLGTQASRQRPYAAEQRDVSSFAAHMTWIASLIQPWSCPAAMKEYKEEGSCHWLHIVPPSSQLPRTVFAYGAFNVPYVGDGTLVDASVLDSATEGWMPHPGYHFLTPSVFEVPLSAAMAARKGENYVPVIGPLGLEGTGHHLVRDMLIASNVSIAGGSSYFRPFSEGLLRQDYEFLATVGPLLQVLETKYFLQQSQLAMGSDDTSEAQQLGLDPILVSYCPLGTGSFPEMVPNPHHRRYTRYYLSVVGMAHVAKAVDEQLAPHSRAKHRLPSPVRTVMRCAAFTSFSIYMWSPCGFVFSPMFYAGAVACIYVLVPSSCWV